MTDKDGAIMEWFASCPFCTDRLLMDFLSGREGEMSIAPMSEDAFVARFQGGSGIKRYTFALQAQLMLSSAEDDVNVKNRLKLRAWQEWIQGQQASSNYPDFGEGCKPYLLENVNNMPDLVLYYENGHALYRFYARLYYIQERL